MNNAGRSAMQMARRLERPIHPVRLYGLHVLGCVSVVVAFLRSGTDPILTIVIGTLVSLKYISVVYDRKARRVREIRAEVRRWRVGAKAEMATYRYLRRRLWWRKIAYKERWFILNDRQVPKSSANIDHIVVGPPGVFVVDSKSRQRPWRIDNSSVPKGVPGVLVYDGATVSTQATRFEADHVRKALQRAFNKGSVPLRITWAIHGKTFPANHWTVEGVELMPLGELGRYMASFPDSLRSGQIEKVARFLEKTFPKAKN